LLISVINDSKKDIGGNSHSEIGTWWLKIWQQFWEVVWHAKSRRKYLSQQQILKTVSMVVLILTSLLKLKWSTSGLYFWWNSYLFWSSWSYQYLYINV